MLNIAGAIVFPHFPGFFSMAMSLVIPSVSSWNAVGATTQEVLTTSACAEGYSGMVWDDSPQMTYLYLFLKLANDHDSR